MKQHRICLLKRCADKLYGGLNMSWHAVILFAVGTAVLTALFLIVPIFKDTSFVRMGVYLEAWIFFAVIIMSNCKKPLESAAKTFMFFLVSQPLIYLFQVPFSWQGWNIFRYYPYWFGLTLLTFPAAFVGWYITKKNWLSVLILSPVMAFLGITLHECAERAVHHFPQLILAGLFCLGQIVVYACVFFPKIPQRIVGLAIPVIAIAAAVMFTPKQLIGMYDTLPGEPELTSTATIAVEDDSVADVSFSNAEYASVYIVAYQCGSTSITVKDGDREYRYSIEIYNDDETFCDRITAIE